MNGDGDYDDANETQLVDSFTDTSNYGVLETEHDAAGNLVQTLPGSRRKGINKVYWNLRMNPPKTAQGGTKIDGGSFSDSTETREDS